MEREKISQTKTSNRKREKNRDNSLLDYYGFTEKDTKNYSVVSNVLKKITLEVKKREIEKINKVKLPKELQKWLNEYKKVGGERDEFAWKVLFKTRQESNYLPIAENYYKFLQKVQFLITVFIVLVDDVADQKGNKILLDELLKIPSMKSCINYDKLEYKEKLYLHFSVSVWEEISSLVRKFPRYKEFKEISKYDMNQTLNAMKYDHIVNNNNYLINKTEYWLYSPHSMRFVMTPTVDLMCSSTFDIGELGALREIFWRAQKMTKIGNWISTWKREIISRDFTSGVFAYAISLKIIIIEDFENNNYKINERIEKSEIGNKLLKEWEKYYWEIFNFKEKVDSLNVQKFLSFLEKLLMLEIVSEKYK